MTYFPHFRTWPRNHDRRSHLSRFPTAGCGRSDLGVRNRRALCRPAAVDQGAGGGAGSGAQLLRRRDISARSEIRRRDFHADRGGRRGGGRRGEIRRDAGVRAALAKRGVRIASVCSGAYMLAEAGLLDGRRATTHWRRTRHFLKTYPKVKLEPDRIFVRDGNIWRSAGITAGIDLALALATEDFGEEVARETARQLVLYERRSGGQSQFSSLLELKAPSGRFAPLLTWAREHLDAPLTVEDLAEQAGMSSRHFVRAFIAETGTTPSKAVERLRIEVARQRVQSSSEAIERVARANRLSRSGADAPRLHPRLRPATAIAAPRGAGRLGRQCHNPGDVGGHPLRHILQTQVGHGPRSPKVPEANSCTAANCTSISVVSSSGHKEPAP